MFLSLLCIETVASWQHYIDYNTTSDSQNSGCHICRADVREKASPLTKNTQLKTFNEFNVSQLARSTDDICTRLPTLSTDWAWSG